MAKSAKERRDSNARRKVEQLRREQRARALRIRVLSAAGALVVIAAVVVGIVLGTSGSGGSHPAAGSTASSAPAGSMGPEGVALETGPVLAPVSAAATGQTVDGVACNTSEQAVSHIHAHVAVYVNGAPRQIPAGIGVVQPSLQQTANGAFASATHCYYWLHTHAADGIIHVESPTQQTYTLGSFFDIWRQPLSAHQAGPATGPVTAFVNGKKYTGDPRSIPLSSHAVIQIDVGKVIAPGPVDWSQAQL